MMKEITHFQDLVYKATKKITKGKVSTYGDIALFIGKPRAYRAVGTALNHNPYAPKVPCHRVVASDGTLGGFASGLPKKIKILKREGIKIKSNKILDFDKVRMKF